MPTGYTMFIEDGKITTAKDFIMLCARAFGATIEMRDEPLLKPIPERFEPDDYYTKALERERLSLEKYRAMTPEEVHIKNEERYQGELEAQKIHQEEQKRLFDSYMSVLSDVKRWEPPTDEHKRLKEFAIEQIEMSLPDLDYSHRTIEKPTDEEWLNARIESCIHAIEDYKKYIKEEQERCDSQNKWLKDLRDSLENL